MRYVRFDPATDKMAEDRQVADAKDLAEILAKADYNDWLEGMGQPKCDYDLKVWHQIGLFLRENAK